jgi:hypothetical protein
MQESRDLDLIEIKIGKPRFCDDAQSADEYCETHPLKTDIEKRPSEVRFTPESGHRETLLGCLLCAKSRHGEARLIDRLGARNGLIILAWHLLI